MGEWWMWLGLIGAVFVLQVIALLVYFSKDAAVLPEPEEVEEDDAPNAFWGPTGFNGWLRERNIDRQEWLDWVRECNEYTAA